MLLFDEPVNGLDPDGIRWVRNFLKGLAREGKTVFVSSHLMSEMALTADQVIIIGRGRLIAQVPIDELLGPELPTLRPGAFPEIAKLKAALEVKGAIDGAARKKGRFR